MIDSPAYRLVECNGAGGRATRAVRSLAAASWLQQPMRRSYWRTVEQDDLGSVRIAGLMGSRMLAPALLVVEGAEPHDRRSVQ